MSDRIEGHGGIIIAAALRARGIESVFTLIGGHIFPMLDGAAKQDLRVVDVRHEQTAGFAAEAFGKLSRRPGVAIVDAGPGTVNALNPLVSAQFHGSPMIMIGGRTPEGLRGRGSLQDIDHLPIVTPITKHAETVMAPGDIARAIASAVTTASARHRGPVYLQFPLDMMLTPASADVSPSPSDASAALRGSPEDAVRALSEAAKPVILFGSDVWADGAEKAARDLSERLRLPTFTNGMGRGTLPADHALAFSAARSHAFRNADLVVVVGTPLDFRLGYGVFGAAKVIHVVDDEPHAGLHANPIAWIAGPLADACEALGTAGARDREGWIAELRAAEHAKRAEYQVELRSDAAAIHPSRIYGELVPRLARDAIVIADGGDFASYAGKYVDVYEQGGWLDPGPYGCLGTSAGYALAASTLHPDRRIVVLLGDGAAGFSMGDWDSLVRFGVNVTLVCGNNGTWGLEKGPMQIMYGHGLATDIRPGVRYDEVMRALGGHGEFVESPAQIGPALERALTTSGPSLVNILTDPGVLYPRSGGM